MSIACVGNCAWRDSPDTFGSWCYISSGVKELLPGSRSHYISVQSQSISALDSDRWPTTEGGHFGQGGEALLSVQEVTSGGGRGSRSRSPRCYSDVPNILVA